MDDRDGRLGLFRGVQEAEGRTALGVDHPMEIDFANPFELADVECILAEQFPWAAALEMALLERQVGLLDQSNLLVTEDNRFGGHAFFELEQAIAARAETLFVRDLLHRRK